MMLAHSAFFSLFLLVILFGSPLSVLCHGEADEADSQDGFLLDSSNFDKVVNGQKYVLVKFFAPWCGHCKAMAKDYKRLHQLISKLNSDVIIAKVNAADEPALAQRFGIPGYPTLYWFPKGVDSSKHEKYEGGRDWQSMLRFVKEKAHLKVDIPEDRKYSRDVTLKTLEEITEKSNAFGIAGFPTFKFLGGTDKQVEDYVGPRDPEAMVSFINTKCKTFRRLDGSLTPEAGINGEFEGLAKEILLTKSPQKEPYLPKIKELQDKFPGFSGDFYAKLLTKILQDGSYAFMKTELDRIENVLKAGSIEETQSDQFQIRQNVLSRLVAIVKAAGDVYVGKEEA